MFHCVVPTCRSCRCAPVRWLIYNNRLTRYASANRRRETARHWSALNDDRHVTHNGGAEHADGRSNQTACYELSSTRTPNGCRASFRPRLVKTARLVIIFIWKHFVGVLMTSAVLRLECSLDCLSAPTL